MSKAWLAFAIAGLMAVWSASASAVTLFDNGGPAYPDAQYSDTAIFLEYNTFTLTSAATITGINWWGCHYPDGTVPVTGDIFYYDIQTDPGSLGHPSGEIANGLLGNGNPSDTGTQVFVSPSVDIYAYSGTTSIPLSAGTYFLSIYDTASDSSPFLWSVNAAGYPDEWEYTKNANPWVGPTNGQLAFNLTGDGTPGAVPEPATMTLLGLGLAGLIGRRMRRSSGK